MGLWLTVTQCYHPTAPVYPSVEHPLQRRLLLIDPTVRIPPRRVSNLMRYNTVELEWPGSVLGRVPERVPRTRNSTGMAGSGRV